ncbi:methionyl-tRNA formyltransferase [Kitasatospora mediocidica]|uniref:methionyl-tRNA formyltransferase n=1 Tax=Kitasatospora mediocidica TaxID=58352 RepID=UPI001E33B9A7|nr:formyltransferase family protein [Kitasatospora mediocidica]
MRIGLVSFGPREFEALHTTCSEQGHDPVVHVYCRSMRPRTPTDAYSATVAGQLLRAIPAGIDLLLPGSSEGLADALPGYRLDLLVVYGFSWRLPPSVLRIPRLGVLNIHSSLLPQYRGPAPVLWAIRNGDSHLGVTVHRMDETFDTGPVIARRGGIPIEDDVTPDRLWPHLGPVIRGLLADALQRVADGDPGEPQDEPRPATPACWNRSSSPSTPPGPSRRCTTRSAPSASWARTSAPSPRSTAALTVLRTRTSPGSGIRLECADGPIWITESAPPQAP